MNAADTPYSDDSVIPASERRQVLIAADNPYFLTAACQFLGICGHRTSRVSNGEDVLGLVREGKTQYDTILLDDSIDNGAGLRLVGALRDGGYQGRVVIKSVKLSPALKEAYQSLGIDAFVETPVDMHYLLRLVQTPSAGTTAQA